MTNIVLHYTVGCFNKNIYLWNITYNNLNIYNSDGIFDDDYIYVGKYKIQNPNPSVSVNTENNIYNVSFTVDGLRYSSAFTFKMIGEGRDGYRIRCGTNIELHIYFEP